MTRGAVCYDTGTGVFDFAGSSLSLQTIPAQPSSGGSAKLYDFTISGADQTSIDSAVDGSTVANFSTYDLLEIWMLARTDEVAVRSTAGVVFNNDTGANYDIEQLRGLGAGVASAGAVAANQLTIEVPGASATANYASTGRVSIPSYRGTTFYKTMEMLTGYQQSGAGACFASNYVGTWRSTAAITRVAVTGLGGVKLKVGSRMMVFGR